jgi:hypothetical protein
MNAGSGKEPARLGKSRGSTMKPGKRMRKKVRVRVSNGSVERCGPRGGGVERRG